MKMTCKRQDLAVAFQTVNGVVPTKTPKPILQNAKIEAGDGQVTLLATDGDVSIRYTIPESQVEVAGAVLVPTNRVLSILREMQGEMVTIETTASNVRILGERADYKLGYENPDQYPTIAEFTEQNYHTLEAGALRQLIRRTIFSVDNESTRYALGGVLVDLRGDQATLAATDTRRLSIATGKCAVQGSPSGEASTPVVPAKAMALIERSLAEETAQVQLAIRANDVIVRGGQATIYSRLVEGRFPRYQDVVPADFKFSLNVQAGSFLAVVRQAQIVTNEESRGVDFCFAPGVLTLISLAPDIGESKVELPISYEGDELTVSLDPRFVSEFLRVLDPATNVRVELTDGESAVVFKTDDGSIYIVMPLSRDR